MPCALCLARPGQHAWHAFLHAHRGASLLARVERSGARRCVPAAQPGSKVDSGNILMDEGGGNHDNNEDEDLSEDEDKDACSSTRLSPPGVNAVAPAWGLAGRSIWGLTAAPAGLAHIDARLVVLGHSMK